jgi:hypothetical protein
MNTVIFKKSHVNTTASKLQKKSGKFKFFIVIFKKIHGSNPWPTKEHTSLANKSQRPPYLIHHNEESINLNFAVPWTS